MPPPKNYTGQKNGMLTALRPDTENKGKWIFRCDCGNEKSINPSTVFREGTENVTKSCGCLRKNRKHFKNLKGKTFGMLTVIKMTRVKNKYSYWECLCECGKSKEIMGTSLTSGNTQSCGCKAKKKSSETAKILKERYVIGGTNIAVSRKKEPNKNNKTGVRGVCFDKSRGLYIASITIKRKQRTLGRFAKLEDAIKARKKAEEERDKILDELEENNND